MFTDTMVIGGRKPIVKAKTGWQYCSEGMRRSILSAGGLGQLMHERGVVHCPLP